ncbi:MAG: ABC transporter substrate-binding protein [Bacteroidaceae bacterium]|nr:ABC transporter substrate-binding protein [Bacteroidaceae bacterium]
MRDYARRWLAVLVLLLVGTALWAAKVRVGVLLPLKEQTGRATTLVEFYQGLLMAVDQARQDGTDVDVYAYDCGSDESHLQQVLADPNLARLDVIFGPIDAVQVTTLSEFCRKNRIRMVLPFNTPCPQVYSNPWIYQVGVTQELLYPGIASLITDNLSNSNFVIFRTGEKDARGQSFTEHVGQVLKLRNMPVSELSDAGDELAYDRALNQFRTNVVVPDSRSQTALARMLKGIKEYQKSHTQYRIKLLGYPEWLTYTANNLQDFYKFDTHIYSSYYRNPLSGRVAKFEQAYRQNFGHSSRPLFPRAEMLGYDLGYYFLSGLATLGEYFEADQEAIQQQPVQHYFRFQRVGEGGGFVNLHVQLVHYGTNKTISVVK